MSDLMLRRRRAMMGAKSAAVEPIYRISNYDFNNGVIDTSVLLAQEGSIGYSIIAKVDCSNNTIGLPTIINGAGIYRSYSYIYLTNAKPVYGIQSFSGGNQSYYPPAAEQKTWLSSICISVNLQAMTTCVFMNDRPANNGTITSFATPTETLGINPNNRRNTNIVLDWLEIYPYPMTEAQMRALVQQ